MQHLHTELENLGPENVVQVTLDRQANVQLLDDANYARYRSGSSFEYFGGLAKRSPMHLSPPRRGRWHLVVDLGGHDGRVNVGTKIF